VSPNGAHAIAVDVQGTATVVLRSEIRSDADALIVEPLTTAAHRLIAEQFLASERARLPDEVARGLEESLRHHDGGWWWFWVRRTRADPDVNKAWLTFRRKELESSLRAHLETLALSADARERAFQCILRSREAPAPSPPDGDLRALRRTARFAVDSLSEEQLRALLLPLGLVYDALRARG